MPRRHYNAGPREHAGRGARAPAAFIPSPLGRPKYTRNHSGVTDGTRRSR